MLRGQLLLYVPKRPDGSDLIFYDGSDQRIRVNSGEPTGRGDLSCGGHNSVKHIFDRHTAVGEIVSSGDGHVGIRNQGWGYVHLEGDVSGGNVVLVTSGRGDVEGLSSLEN